MIAPENESARNPTAFCGELAVMAIRHEQRPMQNACPIMAERRPAGRDVSADITGIVSAPLCSHRVSVASAHPLESNPATSRIVARSETDPRCAPLETTARPRRQKPAVTSCQLILPVTPRDFFQRIRAEELAAGHRSTRHIRNKRP